jgi:hypothetical protein
MEFENLIFDRGFSFMIRAQLHVFKTWSVTSSPCITDQASLFAGWHDDPMGWGFLLPFLVPILRQ